MNFNKNLVLWCVLLLAKHCVLRKVGECVQRRLGACKVLQLNPSDFIYLNDFHSPQPEGFLLKTSIEINLSENKHSYENNLPVEKKRPIGYNLDKAALVTILILLDDDDAIDINLGKKYYRLAELKYHKYFELIVTKYSSYTPILPTFPYNLHLEMATSKPPQIPKDISEKRFKELMDRIIVGDQMVSSSNQVYYEIANEFGVEKQTIYLAVKRYIKDNNLVSTKNEMEYDSNEDEYVPLEYFGNNFKTEISDMCIQLNIENVNIFHKSLNETSISPDWSDTFSGILWEFFRLPCAWRFERLRQICNEFVIVGRCMSMDCAKIFGYTQSGSTILHIRLRAFNDAATHVRKATVKNSRKDVITELLKTNAPCVVEAKLANELMADSDDYVPANLPTKNALAVQKFRSKKTFYLNENPILAIRDMKDLNVYKSVIGDIGLDPFYCHYCTPMQQEIVLSRSRYRRTVLSLDSTGLPTQDMLYSSVSEDDNERYKDNFLYVLSHQSSEGNIPAFQFISQRQNSDFIQYSLACWKTKHFTSKNPDEVIMDHSSALLLSCIQCFTSCKTMQQYLNECYDALFDGSEPPRCYIRLDRSHLVKEILHLPCMKNEEKRRKRLYQRIFGYLISMDNIAEIQQILKELFIILFNRFENDEYVSVAKVHLRNICEKHFTDESESEIEFGKETDENLFSTESKFRKWIDDLVQTVKEEFVNEALNNSTADDLDHNLIDNIYYAPHLEKPFKDFLVRLPLFTNIMNKAFGSTNTGATSSPTEVGFHVIKNLVINTNRKVRMDVLLEKHIEFLKGNLNANRKNNAVDESKYNITVENQHFDELCKSQEEDWRKKNIDARPKTTSYPTKRSKTSILNPAKPSAPRKLQE